MKKGMVGIGGKRGSGKVGSAQKNKGSGNGYCQSRWVE